MYMLTSACCHICALFKGVGVSFKMPYKTAFAPGSTPCTAHITSLIDLGPFALPCKLVLDSSKPSRYSEYTCRGAFCGLQDSS